MRKNNRSFFLDQNNAFNNGYSMSVEDVTSEVYKRLHDECFAKAVDRMKQELLSEYIDNDNYHINIVEQININDILSAPNVIVTILLKNSSTNILKRYKISLEKWWDIATLFSDSIYSDKTLKDDSKFSKSLEFQNYECIYKDYINGTCLVRSKITDETKKISFKLLNNINKDSAVIPDSEDMQKIYTDNFYSINV